MTATLSSSSRIAIVEIPSELGAGTRGSSLGIAALKTAAFNAKNDFFIRYPSFEIFTENHILHEDVAHPFAKNIAGIVNLYSRTVEQIHSLYESHSFLVVLSGDHSCAGGTIAGIKKHYPEKRLGVIWIDAHADMHTPYTTPSGNVHGMPLMAAIADDNIENRINDVDEETISYWNALKNMGGIAPKVGPQDIVFMALRDTEEQEDQLIEKYGIKNFAVEEIRCKGAEKAAQEVMERLSECDIIYVSFDVDSIDSKFSEGTGTPVPNGISAEEAKSLLSKFVRWDKCVCLEVTEVNPTLDISNVMAEMTFDVIESVVKG